MSLIMAIANKDFVLFGGEKRLTKVTEKTINDNYKKVHKINKDVLVVYAGDLTYCEIITEQLFNKTFTDEEKRTLSFSDVDRIIDKHFNSVVSQVEDSGGVYRKAKAYVVIGGIQDNTIKLNAYFYEDTLKTYKHVLNELAPKLIVLGSGQYNHNDYFISLFNKKPIVDINNLKQICKLTVDNGIKFDTSINNNLIFEEIVRR